MIQGCPEHKIVILISKFLSKLQIRQRYLLHKNQVYILYLFLLILNSGGWRSWAGLQRSIPVSQDHQGEGEDLWTSDWEIAFEGCWIQSGFRGESPGIHLQWRWVIWVYSTVYLFTKSGTGIKLLFYFVFAFEYKCNKKNGKNLIPLHLPSCTFLLEPFAE